MMYFSELTNTFSFLIQELMLMQQGKVRNFILSKDTENAD